MVPDASSTIDQSLDIDRLSPPAAADRVGADRECRPRSPMVADSSSIRSGVAIISNAFAPYRVHLHEQVVRRIPEIKLHSLITHGAAEFDWKAPVPDSINPVYFGSPGESPLGKSLASLPAEWRKGARIIEYLREHDIRAVVMNGYRYLSYLRVIQYCHRAGIPIFVRNDSNIRCERSLPAWKRFLKTRLYHWWLPRTTGVMSMGEFGDEFFRSYGADPAKFYRVPVLPDLQLFAEGVPDRLHQFRRKYGLREDRRYLLYSGRLVPQKRVDLCIDAFQAIADRRPDWDLLVVGDGVCAERLRARVPDRLSSRVIWAGFQQLEGCVDAYHASDVLVLPSDREPWAAVVQEALAAGLPVVASDVVGAAKELVEDGVSGRVFAAGNLVELTGALLDVTDPSAVESYQLGAKSAIERWKSQVDPVAEIRRALVDGRVLNAN